MKNKKLNILCCAFLTVLCVGCGQTSAQRNGKTAKPPASNKTTVAKPVEKDSAATGREIDFRDAESQLKNLKSYGVHYLYKDHLGDAAEQSAVTFIEYKKEINNETGDRHLFLNQQGGIAAGVSEAFQIAGQNYLAMSVPNLDKPSLTKMPGGEARLPFTPIDVCRATGFRTARLVAKSEKIGGIIADHYRWEKSAPPSRWDLATLKGDVWLAQDGGYVVKYLVEGMSVDTRATHWEYTVEGVNSIGEIKLP
ncbi:MAG: hypothetical protein M3033_03600 [Acidobacteriota bacterium]|nr:hypothetical protein [Acidobacteriota bacterium]